MTTIEKSGTGKMADAIATSAAAEFLDAALEAEYDKKALYRSRSRWLHRRTCRIRSSDPLQAKRALGARYSFFRG